MIKTPCAFDMKSAGCFYMQNRALFEYGFENRRTVDELLGVEQIDEWAYIDDCCEKSAQLQAQGKKSEIIQVTAGA
ncbi:MAG: hypothetical protein IKZ19_05325, partial [Clostridia bacterium]|nr:hypothetical protein [Clostridia bacterium]